MSADFRIKSNPTPRFFAASECLPQITDCFHRSQLWRCPRLPPCCRTQFFQNNYEDIDPPAALGVEDGHTPIRRAEYYVLKRFAGRVNAFLKLCVCVCVELHGGTRGNVGATPGKQRVNAYLGTQKGTLISQSL